MSVANSGALGASESWWVAVRWRQVLVAVLLIVTGLAPVGRAQQIDPDPDSIPICNQPPETGGQWSGPWDLSGQINRGPLPLRYSEIAHAVLLPPPNAGWVLFWAARYCVANLEEVGPASRAYETFLWHPQNPGSVVRVPVPSALPFGSDDLFCGGQVITPEGLVVVFGGTDIQAACYDGQSFLKGHSKVWIFDNRTKIDLNTTPWTLPLWVDGGEDMLRARWYATCAVTWNDRLLVGAHAGPDVSPPPPQSPHSSRIREYGLIALGFTPALQWLAPPGPFWRNWRYTALGFLPCDKIPTEGLGDMALYSYEHVRQLTDRRLIAIAGRRNADFPYPLLETFFLDMDACPQDLVETERWVAGPNDDPLPGQTVAKPFPKVEGAPSVHIIDDSVDPPLEVIYSIGGGNGETTCPTTTTDAVLKMVLPAAAPGLEEWEPAPSLGRPRNSSNGAVGLDGSIFVMGGLKPKLPLPEPPEPPICVPVLKAERLRPPEIFRTGNTTSWVDLCPQAHQRSYHSVLVALEDGRFASMGGTSTECNPFCDPPLPCYHSVEIFAPPYLFQGEQPVILNPVLPSGLIDEYVSGQFVPLDVLLPGTVDPESEFRVALLRPGAVTHANDMSARYIKLHIDPVTLDKQDPPLASFLRARIPSSKATAPAGDYMITVVSSEGVPSVAKWLRIKP